MKRKFLFKKKYLFGAFIVVVLGFFIYKNFLEKKREKEFFEYPPIVKQTWPSSSNPDGLVLNIPANYIDGGTFIFEPILKEKEEKKRKARIKAGKEKICDVYTCQELFEVLLPKFEPKNLENLHIFKAETPKDMETYHIRIMLFKLESWAFNGGIGKEREAEFSIPKNYLSTELGAVFHTKNTFLNGELFNYINTKKRSDLGLIEVTSLKQSVPGGFYRVVPHKEWDKKYPEDVIEDAQHHKIFFKKNTRGSVTTYIRCDSQTSVVKEEKLEAYADPKLYRCKHNFDIPELSVNISANYSDKYLSDWQGIEKKLTLLIKTFQEK
ncbi:hypothetical protein VXO68_00710 [Acinetobacter oleivorans]|uniref:hypothetical protein n=1 Tax=Acinetobacter oleivorans TaxID=1148157 RepID=UPI003A8AFBB2